MNAATLTKYRSVLDPGVENPTTEQYWEACARFTNACCYDERKQYALVLETSTDACWHPTSGIVCDLITERKTGKTFSLVAHGGTADQQPKQTEVEGMLTADDSQVEPVDPKAYVKPPMPPEIPDVRPPVAPHPEQPIVVPDEPKAEPKKK